MKVKSALLFFIIIQFLFASLAYSADNTSSTIVQMDKAEAIIYGETRRGGLIERLNDLETVLFGRSLPGSISERQLQLLNFIQTGSAEQPSLLFKLGVAEWAISQTIHPFIPALGRLQKLEQDLDNTIHEGRPIAMRVERVLSILLTNPVTQVELVVSTDRAIRGKFLDSIGPGHSKKGDSIKMELVEDFIEGDYLIAPKGSQIVAEVVDVKRPGAFGRPGRVKFELKYLRVLGPEELKIDLADPNKIGAGGEKNIAAAAGASMVGAVLLGPLGLATGLLIRGDSLEVNAGTQFFLQLTEGARISAFPIPAGLRRADGHSDVNGSTDSDNSDIILIP